MYKLKPNTATGGFSLHTEFGYAYCPFQQEEVPCGTWCALFRKNEDRKSITLTCSSSVATIFIEEDKE